MTNKTHGNIRESLRSVYDRIETDTARFAAESKLRCPEGCGQCCNNPKVDATIDEMMLIAEELFDEGVTDEYFDRAEAALGQPCILFRKDSPDGRLGRCTRYQNRPSLCRLFGFAAVHTRTSKAELAACKVHKQTQPEVVGSAQAAINQGAFVPVMSDYGMEIVAASGGGHRAERLPINEALSKAIALVALSRQYEKG